MRKNNMSATDLKPQLTLRVSEALHYLWDPIGVSDEPAARDEYYSYVEALCQAVSDHRSEQEIADMLSEIRTQRMGLPPHPHHDLQIAELLCDWARHLQERSTW
jgi:hypothetical protein